eukprot:gb/GFBE01002384.1/.p1 GENE.gb/GFBE01002384.1/~~gb/GFBE01002384.1/.p1  ORF type:complete len:553 (+),score=115.54 gb/GFBE01002384.1/:1-1659(+)
MMGAESPDSRPTQVSETGSLLFLQLLDRLREAHALEVQSLLAENRELKEKAGHLNAGSSTGNRAGKSTGLDGSSTPCSQVSSVHLDYEERPGANASPCRAAWQDGRDDGEKDDEAEQERPSIRRSITKRLTEILPGRPSKGDVLPFESIQEKKQHTSIFSFTEDLIHRPWFESLFGVLILLNAGIMGLEAQYSGLILGAEIDSEPESADGMTDSLWPGATTAFEVFGWFFGVAFTLEVVLKIIGQRARFMFFVWNWIDFILVVLWIVSCFGASMPIDPNLLRLARLARLVRLLRLAHKIKAFDALYLISTSLTSSMSILCWAVAMFFLCQVTLALFLTNFLSEVYLGNTDIPKEDRQAVFTYFGTFSRSVFSMFELTLANWPPISRLLAENVSQWFFLFAVLHKLTVGFAFVGVVNGVFMQETFKVASTDDRIMVRQKQRMVNTHTRKMKMFFDRADTSGDGTIDLDEFKMMASNPAVSLWLSSMELDEKDNDLLFKLIDNGDASITLDELIKGVGKLKGNARSIDMVRVMRDLANVKAMLQQAGFSAPRDT